MSIITMKKMNKFDIDEIHLGFSIEMVGSLMVTFGGIGFPGDRDKNLEFELIEYLVKEIKENVDDLNENFSLNIYLPDIMTEEVFNNYKVTSGWERLEIKNYNEEIKVEKDLYLN